MSSDTSEVGPEPGQRSSNGPATVRIHVGPEQRPSIQIQISEDQEGSSSVSSVFTLCNSAIGAGVLSLPYAFRYSGAERALLLTPGSICMHTACQRSAASCYHTASTAYRRETPVGISQGAGACGVVSAVRKHVACRLACGQVTGTEEGVNRSAWNLDTHAHVTDPCMGCRGGGVLPAVPGAGPVRGVHAVRAVQVLRALPGAHLQRARAPRAGPEAVRQ